MSGPLVRCGRADGADTSSRGSSRDRKALSARGVDGRQRWSADAERPTTAVVLGGADESVERFAVPSANLFETAEALEGMTAFLEKRTPARVR